MGLTNKRLWNGNCHMENVQFYCFRLDIAIAQICHSLVRCSLKEAEYGKELKSKWQCSFLVNLRKQM